MKIEFFTIDELNYFKEHCDFTEDELYLLDEKSKGKTLEETGFDIDTLNSVKNKIRKVLEDRKTKRMTVADIKEQIKGIEKVWYLTIKENGDKPLREVSYNLINDILSISAMLDELDDRPKAKWEIDGHHRRCKKCGEYFCIDDREGDEIPHNFCGNCGARMEDEQ